MKKLLIAILIIATLIICSAVPVMASNGVSIDNYQGTTVTKTSFGHYEVIDVHHYNIQSKTVNGITKWQSHWVVNQTAHGEGYYGNHYYYHWNWHKSWSTNVGNGIVEHTIELRSARYEALGYYFIAKIYHAANSEVHVEIDKIIF